MPKGLAFWLIMLLWILFSLFWNRAELRSGNYGFFGGNLMLFILLFLLGWATFGFIVY